MRAGDTIPTANDINGETYLNYKDANNTVFGAPPVLVLRVGDFFNTKIIPNSLGITYEDLDFNPEGIGVQPMIANITLSFNFVGGSGLKESIDKLQNALTFNYYANTEVYDDRADVTDIADQLPGYQFPETPPQDPPALNQAAPNDGKNNNGTIGSILTSNISSTGETGTISYTDFMNGVITQTQNYFVNIVNKNREILSQYNNAMRQEWMISRDYHMGNIIDNTPVVLFGKPSNVQKRIYGIFDSLSDDIDNNNEGFIKFINSDIKNFSTKLKRTVKHNYLNFLKNKKSSYLNAAFKIIQDLTNVQQSYIKTLAQMNVVAFGDTTKGTDGLQLKSGPVIIYITSDDKVAGTFKGITDDIRIIRTDLIDYYDKITSKSSFTYTKNNKTYEGTFVFDVATNGTTNDLKPEEVFNPFNLDDFSNSDLSFRRVYMILSNDIVDSKKYEAFKKALIGNVIEKNNYNDSDIGRQFDAYWLDIVKPKFITENNIAEEFINNIEKNGLKTYLTYSPFDKKERVLKYDIKNDYNESNKKSQENMIKGLGNSTNENTNKTTWNDLNGNTAGAYISKAKLN
jgi:hypothetical protein